MFEILTQDSPKSEELHSTLDEIARQGARKLLEEALRQEVAEYLEKAKED